jgi:CubicO group peptidase (beta-lactamase class C family)
VNRGLHVCLRRDGASTFARWASADLRPVSTRLRLGALLLLLAPCYASPPNDPALAAALQPILEKHHLPALAGALVTGDGAVRIGVVGVRKAGTVIAATPDDLWHLGSNTKALTATVIARLVEQGKLTWDTTLAEVFPDLAADFDSAFRPVTIRQLLSHHAGLTGNLAWGRFNRSRTIQEQRGEALRLGLAKSPTYPIGAAPHYANLGYVIAGAIIERVTGQAWEEVVRTQLFGLLQMTRAGFGGLGAPGELDQPWPHQAADKPAQANGPDVDNPPVIGPAGRVHAPLADWAKFVADQLRGARGEPALLKAESYASLHAVAGEGDFALGWIVAQRGWGGGTVLTHSGCNTMNYSVAWLAPKRNFAVLVCINQGDDVAARAADEAAAALIGLHAPAAAP